MFSAAAHKAGLFGLAATFCSSFGQTFFIGLFGAEFRDTFELSTAGLGLMYGSATLASGFAMFWLGELADRFNLGRAITIALRILALGCGLIATADTSWLLLPGLFLLRLGGQGLVGHLAVVAAARHTARHRGRSVAMASYGFFRGEALLPLAVAGLLGLLDWRTVWLLAAGLLLLAALPGLPTL